MQRFLSSRAACVVCMLLFATTGGRAQTFENPALQAQQVQAQRYAALREIVQLQCNERAVAVAGSRLRTPPECVSASPVNEAADLAVSSACEQAEESYGLMQEKIHAAVLLACMAQEGWISTAAP